MSNRTKRKLENFDPNASDPEDLDWDAVERPSPARRRKRHTSGAPRKKGSKRQRRGYSGSDVDDDDDELLTDNSFTDERSSSEEVEINPATGRSVRRATKKQIKYEESEEDEIKDTDSEDELAPSPSKRRDRNKAQQSIERPSLIVKLRVPGIMPQPARSTRTRQGSKSVIETRGRTPDVMGTRRSNRLSHDIEEPMIELSDSGRHTKVVRPGTRSPEPSASRPSTSRATRGGKGPRHSAIMEASQEDSMHQDETGGPLDNLLAEIEETTTQVPGSQVGSPEQDAQAAENNEENEDDEEMQDGVIQESQNDAPADDSDDEDGPVTRGGGRSLRSAKRKRAVDESSDFEPVAEDEKDEEEEEMSDAAAKGRPSTSGGDSGSGSGRRSARVRASQRNKSRRNSDSSDQDSALDEDELAEEAEELMPSKRRRLNRRKTDTDLVYDEEPKRRNRARNTVDYRIVRPELNAAFDDEENGIAVPGQSRSRAGRSTYRSLFSNQGPFGGGLEAGAMGGADSDSSDDEVQKMPKSYGGAVGMTPTTATAPGMGFPQTHNADAKQDGGGPANLGKVKDRKALADADPLGVDTNVTFDGVGGLDNHINQLKEMVMLPLLYPEIFQKFKTTPPRGVLFHGPPGTGKTLLARALASSVSQQGQKVTFYMRKGADALSKWVGEAEKQLRLLFEEARKNQPSIIFFDEIDGLAPVRSSKQEQIHASIVATLLALMDGMDGRGQVIVIGATNRPDSVDPALRRPGRFDREFYFPLPDAVGRRAIINIHTKGWEPPLKPEMMTQLADLTKGYGGADLRALCTEAALNAVQGTFPQIYSSERKLLIDPAQIKVLAKDFMISINKIVPSSQRSAASSAAPLAKSIEPLLRKPLQEVIERVNQLIPRRKKMNALEEAQYDDRDDEKGFEREMTIRNFQSSRVFRPRLLIHGLEGMGQQYLSSALLSKIEGLHVQSFDLPTIFEDSTRTPEVAITQLFAEVKRHKPSVIYIPAVDVWYATIPDAALRTFKLLLRSIGANEPVLLLGVMEHEHEKDSPDPRMLKDLFSFSPNSEFILQRPSRESRYEFFNDVSHYIRMSPADFPDPDNRKKRIMPELEVAPIIAPVVDPREEAAKDKQQRKRDHSTLNKLKMAIQPIMDQLKKSYRKFFKPILEEEWYAYLLVEDDPNHISSDLPLEQQQAHMESRPWARSKDSKGVDVLLHLPSGNKYYNLDLGNIEKRLSNGYYKRPKDFLFDIKTLSKDSRTYGDPERTLKANEMLTNVEVDIEVIDHNYPGLSAECEAVFQRELVRGRKAQEKREKELAAGKEPTAVIPVPPEQSATATDTSGPIILGEPVPANMVPPVTPMRPMYPSAPFTNGTSGEDGGHASVQNGSTVPSRADEDSHMTDSQDLDANVQQHEFQTPSRLIGTQTQKSQISARTYMASNSNPHDYYNSASTTTSGKKTSDRSSGARFTQGTQSTNGTAPVGAPNFSEMLENQPGGSQFPDTQEFPEDNSQRQQPQSSQAREMPAPPPRQGTAITSILNDRDEDVHRQLIVDEAQLSSLYELIVKNTSGCSLEQLEQINATIMDTIWHDRKEWNRNKVIHNVRNAFNEVITEIERTQNLLKLSQGDLEEELRATQAPARQYHPPSEPQLPGWSMTQQPTESQFP